MKEYAILFVDDEENILHSLRRIFRISPYRVMAAMSGKEALEIMKKERVDVLIADQRMPNMTGVELCRKVKELYPDTIRFILSGYSDITELFDAINQGEVYRFLKKPIDIDRLRDIVDRAIEQSQVIRSFQNMVDGLNDDKTIYRYQVDYTGGIIRIGMDGEGSSLTKEMVSRLLECICSWPDAEKDIKIVNTILERQNGKLTINAEFGTGLHLAVELPIESETGSHEE